MDEINEGSWPYLGEIREKKYHQIICDEKNPAVSVNYLPIRTYH